MVVNPFWFGVLLTIIGLIVVLFVIAFIGIKRSEAEDGDDMLMDEGEFKKMLAEAVRDSLNEALRDGIRQSIVYGEAVEDHDDKAD